jgi:hypothetical protein
MLDPIEVRIPEKLDPPIGGADTSITAILLEIDIINRIVKKHVDNFL